VAGVSATSASYHLRLLARHKIVGEVQSKDHRERPWRILVSPEVNLPSWGDRNRSATISRLFSEANRRDAAVIHEYDAEIEQVPEEWRKDVRIQTILRLSLDEFLCLQQDLREVMQKYQRNAAKPGTGTEENRVFYVSMRVVPWVRVQFGRLQRKRIQNSVGLIGMHDEYQRNAK
jgi:hypothetical protein